MSSILQTDLWIMGLAFASITVLAAILASLWSPRRWAASTQVAIAALAFIGGVAITLAITEPNMFLGFAIYCVVAAVVLISFTGVSPVTLTTNNMKDESQ